MSEFNVSENQLLDIIKIIKNYTDKKELEFLKKYDLPIDSSSFNKLREYYVVKHKIHPKVVFTKQELKSRFKYLNREFGSKNTIKTTYDISKYFNSLKETNKEKSTTIKFSLNTFEEMNNVLKEENNALYVTKKKSTLYDADGNVKLLWTQEKMDDEAYQYAKIKSITKLCEKIPAVDPINLFDVFENCKDKTNRAVFLPLADLHIGVSIEKSRSASKIEWDLKTAEKTFYESIQYLISTAPAAEEFIIADLGDLLHMSDNTNTTPRSKHPLDVSKSYETAMDTMFRMIYKLIDTVLTKYDKVYFYSTPGNHNMDVSQVLREVIRQRYRKLKNRVFVSSLYDNRNIYYHAFKKNLLVFTHGDEIKRNHIDTVTWSDNRETISNYTNIDAYMGHYHQEKQYNQGMVTVRVVKNFTPNDKWADSVGFRNLKNPGYMQIYVYDAEQGVKSIISHNPPVKE